MAGAEARAVSAELVPVPDSADAVDDGENAQALAAIPAQARSDAELLALWLHGRAGHTQRAYQRAVGRFLHSVRRPLPAVTLGDLQAFAAELEHEGLAPASRRLTLAAVKSLLAFGQRVGYLRFDVGAAVKLPPVKDALAERILDREAVLRLIDREPDARNRALLRLLYAGGLRVSEACALRWRDLQPREDAGQVTVYGKGGKTRVVLLSPATWRVLLALPGAQAVAGGEEADAGPGERDAPVFPSRRSGGPLDQPQAWRLIQAAAARVGLPVGKGGVSPHWLRHAHATHALEHGHAPIHLVQATLGHASVATTSKYLHARPTDSSARYLGV
jgi:site-specific recombinase XerD